MTTTNTFRIIAMTERSLFNVVCKIAGLFILIQGITALVWGFLASRNTGNMPFHPSEGESWFTGAVFTALGFFLCCRSSAVTRLLYRLDGPLDEQNRNADQ